MHTLGSIGVFAQASRGRTVNLTFSRSFMQLLCSGDLNLFHFLPSSKQAGLLGESSHLLQLHCLHSWSRWREWHDWGKRVCVCECV